MSLNIVQHSQCGSLVFATILGVSPKLFCELRVTVVGMPKLIQDRFTLLSSPLCRTL